MIYLARYRHLVAQEVELPPGARENGLWAPLIPSSDPKRDLYKLQHSKLNGSDKAVIKQDEMDAPFLGWLRCAWNDFWVELNLFKRGRTKARDERCVDREGSAELPNAELTCRLLRTLGLDAFTILEFLRLLRWLFALITVFVACPLLAANYFINTRTEFGSTARDMSANQTAVEAGGNNMPSIIGDLQLYTAANITGNGLWVHVSAEIAVTLIVILQGASAGMLKRIKMLIQQLLSTPDGTRKPSRLGRICMLCTSSLAG